jgi:16S rRNA (guanine527-N7)-methyltransferase
MDQARIAELLVPFLGPPDNQKSSVRAPEPDTRGLVPRISTYIDILLRWNSKINLTAIRSPEEIVTRHFGESLFAARHLFPKEPHVGTAENEKLQHRGRAALQRREKGLKDRALAPIAVPGQRPATATTPPSLADIGSGAGFPGVPIKLWAPDIALTLIESNHKKAAFLRELARALILTDVNIQNVRAETLPPATFDVVTLRAVERFDAVLPVAASLVAPAGRLALLIGSSQLDAARVVQSFSWQEPITIPDSKARVLLIGNQKIN